MLLKFRIETRKIKQPRIVVLRLSSENGKPVEKSLGSFSSKRGYDHILKELTSEERYEFENFVKTTEFAKMTFSCNADKLDRFIIKAAPEFKKTLFTIWEKAKEYGIDFIPEYEMLLAIFNKAKIVEQQLAVLTNGEFKGFAGLGIDITNINPPKQSIKEDQKLISAAIENAGSLEKLADIFNSITSTKYQKTPKFKAHHLEYLVTQAEQENKQPFPKWYYTVAIDALCQLGIKPDTIASPRLITEHWLRLNKKDSIDKTITAFHQQFKHLKNDPICTNIIKLAFTNDELIKMQQSGQGIPAPSIAAKQWLKKWIEKNPKAKLSEINNAFNKEFHSLRDNAFFMNIFDGLH
jgi:hypothetical protein